MRSNAPSLLPIFRSRHQGELLAELLVEPGTEFTVTELARRTAVPLTTVVRETQRLVRAGLLRDRKVGRNRLVSADPASPFTAPLAQLVVAAFGSRVVVAKHFAPIAGVQKVVIFGSWAARYHGVDGRPPNDIDVLVIGDEDAVSQLDTFAAADRAQAEIGTEVNPVMCTPQQWADPVAARDPLLIEIQHRPHVVAFDAADQQVAA